MTRKATLAMALLLSLGPSVVMAACGHSQAAMSCAEGMVYDQETNTCVTTTG